MLPNICNGSARWCQASTVRAGFCMRIGALWIVEVCRRVSHGQRFGGGEDGHRKYGMGWGAKTGCRMPGRLTSVTGGCRVMGADVAVPVNGPELSMHVGVQCSKQQPCRARCIVGHHSALASWLDAALCCCCSVLLSAFLAKTSSNCMCADAWCNSLGPEVDVLLWQLNMEERRQGS